MAKLTWALRSSRWVWLVTLVMPVMGLLLALVLGTNANAQSPEWNGEDEALAAEQLALDPRLAALAKQGYRVCGLESTRSATVDCVRSNLTVAKKQTRARVVDAVHKRDAERTGYVAIFVFLAGFAGFFLLFTPLVFANRFPSGEQQRKMFGFSVVATGLFMVNMFIFAIAIFFLRLIQTIGAEKINPKLAIVDATFKTLDDRAATLVEHFPQVVEPTIQQVATGNQDSFTVLLLGNADRLRRDAEVFEKFAGQLKWLESVFDSFNLLFAMVAIAVLAIGFTDVFLDIIRLPVRAMVAQERGEGRKVAKASLRTSVREFGVVAMLFVVIGLVTAISAATMHAGVTPAIENLMSFVLLAFMYMEMEPGVSTMAIGLGLGCSALVLVFNIAVVLVSNVLYLSRMQRVLRGRVQWKIPLRQHWRFFVFGTGILIAVQMFPWAYQEVIGYAIQKSLGGMLDGKSHAFGFALWAAGLGLLVGWIALFWFGRGIRALKWLLKYPIPRKPGDEVSTHAPRVEPPSDPGVLDQQRAAEAQRAAWAQQQWAEQQWAEQQRAEQQWAHEQWAREQAAQQPQQQPQPQPGPGWQPAEPVAPPAAPSRRRWQPPDGDR